MKTEKKVEALKRENARLKEKIEELKEEKVQAEKVIEGLHEQISRYMKADASERVRELEEGLRESKARYDAGYQEAIESQKKMHDLMLEMQAVRERYEKMMKDKIKNVKG